MLAWIFIIFQDEHLIVTKHFSLSMFKKKKKNWNVVVLSHVNLTFKVMLFSMLIQFFQMNDLEDLVSLVCFGRHVLSFSSQSKHFSLSMFKKKKTEMLLWHVNLTFKVMLFSMLIQFFQINDLKDLVSLVCLGRHVLSFSSQSRPYFYIIKQRVSRFYINVNLARVSILYRTGWYIPYRQANRYI